MSLRAMREAARWAVPFAIAASVAWATTVGFGLEASWFDEQRIAMLVAMSIALFVALVDRSPADAYGWPSAAIAAALALGVLSALVAPRRDAHWPSGRRSLPSGCSRWGPGWADATSSGPV